MYITQYVAFMENAVINVKTSKNFHSLLSTLLKKLDLLNQLSSKFLIGNCFVNMFAQIGYRSERRVSFEHNVNLNLIHANL